MASWRGVSPVTPMVKVVTVRVLEVVLLLSLWRLGSGFCSSHALRASRRRHTPLAVVRSEHQPAPPSDVKVVRRRTFATLAAVTLLSTMAPGVSAMRVSHRFNDETQPPSRPAAQPSTHHPTTHHPLLANVHPPPYPRCPQDITPGEEFCICRPDLPGAPCYGRNCNGGWWVCARLTDATHRPTDPPTPPTPPTAHHPQGSLASRTMLGRRCLLTQPASKRPSRRQRARQ